ncbi:DUF4388 domain-containing protein [Dictyobacter formicarum]|uniref:DUF4388 domain-containing protein n=1 Tax=Dictyobacter formicarum TaxID=2778368 RepID=A0ABQ3VIE6_9CHLR|nr:DUF4388 domain-containing protein [Dictyobacter formicarum]GHO85143.1 hypothetical protein KSZ_31490 [Dictyobacter formicarum]
MSQQQGRIADHLAHVISTIQANHMTGELRAKKGDDAYAEIGAIFFLEGQAVKAQVGAQQGASAFDVLCTWRNCIFIFVPHSSPYQTSPLSPSTGPQLSPSVSSTPSQPLLPIPGSVNEQQTIPIVSVPLIAVPRATMSIVKAIGVINNAGLPRTYRQILLLIDGQHSVNDIVALANVPLEEVLQILRVLENLAIIRIPT